MQQRAGGRDPVNIYHTGADAEGDDGEGTAEAAQTPDLGEALMGLAG